ncbi:tetratricopeptide repeat protein [Streptomyces sp. NBC_00390]|uniref:tetratricopeptide repeat protein n=1 Tax=Streptomyces sp. NBC_00390 TaxID=2975736 RepID=UPI002E1F602C
MKSETLKKAAVSTLVGATLVTGVVLLAPGWGDNPRPSPGAVTRARAAAGTGVPASLPDLSALIADRERWVSDHPRDDESWAVLGAAYVERGSRLADSEQYPKAEHALKRSLDVLPAKEGNTDALIGLAALAAARHDFAAARTLGESAVRQKPRRWRAHAVLIDAYSGLGDHKAAGRSLDTLRKLSSGPQVLERETQIYWVRGRREDAAALAYDAAAKAATPVARAAALHQLGELVWERGEPAEAVRTFSAALDASPESHRSWAGRARALAALGRTDEAVRDYQEALSQVPLPEYALELGELYESMGLDGDATTQYERLRELVEDAADDGVDNDLVLARLEADHGDPQEAVRMLQAEWRSGHRSMYVADAMAWALHKADRPKEALPFLKPVAAPGMRSALFAYHRGQIERALEDYGPARRHLEEALRINPDFSPLFAPRAREALKALGEPPAGGPDDMFGDDADGEFTLDKKDQESREPSGEEAAGRPQEGSGREPGPGSGSGEATDGQSGTAGVSPQPGTPEPAPAQSSSPVPPSAAAAPGSPGTSAPGTSTAPPGSARTAAPIHPEQPARSDAGPAGAAGSVPGSAASPAAPVGN